MTVGPSSLVFQGPSATYSDIVVIRLNATGAPQWGASFGGSAIANKVGFGVAADSAGKSCRAGQLGGNTILHS